MADTYGTLVTCLLHDFGQLLRRAGVGEGAHGRRGAAYFADKLPRELVEGIRYHHKSDILNANLPADSLSYIACVAASVSAGVDAHTDGEIVLESIFNHLNGANGDARFTAEFQDDRTQYPAKVCANDTAGYARVLSKWESELSGIPFEPEYADALIDLVQRAFAYIPSAACGERADVSMFHHAKTAAAIGSCIERCLRGDLRERLFVNEADFMREQVFTLYTLDMSGIQSFIYTITNKGALKGLRARSFYLSVTMEHIADSILDACGLYRVNLIYSGGGHAHILLPNDGESLDKAEAIVKGANAFLRKCFGAALYLASGFAHASANELMSNGGKSDALSRLFQKTSAMISRRKIRRYSPDEFIELNAASAISDAGRECSICGASDNLVTRDGDSICDTCDRLEKFSTELARGGRLLSVERRASYEALPLPNDMWLCVLTEREARGRLANASETPARLYSVNEYYTGMKRVCRLSVGNYNPRSLSGGALTFEELADASTGISRIAVLRADVDNLGMLFARGFAEAGGAYPWRYVTLARYTALSMALTEFFQREINHIIKSESAWSLPGTPPSGEGRRVSIVYSGGDDVFLVGAWNDVLSAGLALNGAFKRFTGGNVTLSAGYALFKPHEPVGIMARDSAELEAAAKRISGGTKDAISLFGTQGIDYTFRWSALRESVLDEKLILIYNVFSGEGDFGTSFLYNVLTLLRDINADQIAMARLAYLLAKHAPKKSEATIEAISAYDAFLQNVYKWALDAEHNRDLQTAILFYLYANRKERTEDD